MEFQSAKGKKREKVRTKRSRLMMMRNFLTVMRKKTAQMILEMNRMKIRIRIRFWQDLHLKALCKKL